MNVVRHSDQTVVAHLFTRAYGMVPFVVKRPSGGRAGGHAAMLSLLTQLSIECHAPVDGCIQRLSGAEIDEPYVSLPFSMHKTAMSMFLADVLWHALRHEQASDSLYEFVSLSLRWLDGADDGYANFHIVFLLQLTRYMGYDPRMLPEAGELQMDKLMRHNYRTMRLLQLNGRQRSHFLHRLVDFYRQNVPGFPELKSMEILEDTYR